MRRGLGQRQSITCGPAAQLRGQIEVPGDKSLSHRGLIFSALSPGEQVLRGLSVGGDVLATAGILQDLGASLDSGSLHRGEDLAVGETRWREPTDVLDCGNAGTTMRLLAGLLAGRPGLSVLTGDRSLRRRPMGRIVEPLRSMGATVDGREGGRKAPLVVRGGGLRGLSWRSPVASAQVKSCLLLAGLRAEGDLELGEPHRSRDHSERMLRACGVQVEVGASSVAMAGGQAVCAPTGLFEVPRDISAAAFWLVAAAIRPGSWLVLPRVGVNPTRSGVLDVLDIAGVPVQRSSPRQDWGEPSADLVVNGGDLLPFEVGGGLVPRLIDEIPVLAVLAARAPGVSTFRDAADLRAKESDRIASTVAMLSAFGVRCEARDDGLVVHGDPRRPLRAARVDAAGDHRIAMAAAVAALCADGPSVIEGADAVATSYPTFFEDLESCRG